MVFIIIHLIHLHQRLMCFYPRRLGRYLKNKSPRGPLAQSALDVNHHCIRKGFEKMTYRYMIACRRSHDWIERMTLLFIEGHLTLFEYKVIAAFTRGGTFCFCTPLCYIGGFGVLESDTVTSTTIKQWESLYCIIFLIMVGESV